MTHDPGGTTTTTTAPPAPAEPVTTDQLAAIPTEHRRLISRWLTERAAQFTPSWLCPQDVSHGIQNALNGAAVDLADPLTDDSTLSHAAGTLTSLAPGTLTPGAQVALLFLIGRYAGNCASYVHLLHSSGDPTALAEASKESAELYARIVRAIEAAGQPAGGAQ